jgi:hypothetical protein
MLTVHDASPGRPFAVFACSNFLTAELGVGDDENLSNVRSSFSERQNLSEKGCCMMKIIQRMEFM